ncbi:glycoside hydrolase family 65 protein [Enterococcus sp. LJL90]
MKNLTITEIDEQFILTLATEKYVFSTDSTASDILASIKDSQITSAIEVIHLDLTNKSGTLQTKAKSLAKELSETLNVPLVFVSQQEETDDVWQFNYYDLKQGKEEYSIESMLTVGNGFIGLRGTTPEMTISDDFYPATYLAGVYNETKSVVEGQEITNEDLVNVQSMQGLSFAIDGEVFNFSQGQILEMERTLALNSGLFTSRMIYENQKGQQALVTTEKIVSMAQRNLYSLRYQVTPLNFSGEITIFAEGNGAIFNYNVARYRSLNQQHLEIDEISGIGTNAKIIAHTSDSNIAINQESKLQSYPETTWETAISEKKIQQTAKFTAAQGETVTVEKTVFVEISTAKKIQQPTEFPNFSEVFQASKKAWEKLWEQADIKVASDYMSQKLLRLHTFHLLASASPLSAKEIDASVTARGLHGEAYRGHIFWDELFILPFYIMHFPNAAKQLLQYRYDRLPEAKKLAEQAGYQGAMFPWQSGLTGDEQSQEIHLNPVSGDWDEDHSRLQRHVSLAVAYNFWLYYQNTLDQEFMTEMGLEMLLEIAKFWLKIAEKDYDGRYNINGVMGPDEFHEAYPNQETGGLNNNAYTNMTVVWLFEEIAKLFAEMPAVAVAEIRQKTDFSAADSKQMEEICHGLNLEINEAGIIAQFANYFELKEVDWDYYREKYGNIYRMDRILRAEGESADDYQVAKQADTLMTFYNFSKERIDQILADLGYNLPEDYLEKNLDYYLARTSHGSTLSRVVHAQLAEIIDNQDLAWQLYQEALYSDYRDIQGGTTAEGIHAGVMAATLYITLTTFAGLDIRQDKLILQPKLPKGWQELQFKVKRRGIHFSIAIRKETTTILADQDVEIEFNGKQIFLTGNQATTLDCLAMTN